ncbi:YoaH family protein [Paenibacillus methanolicus]|uniref:Heat induced stress protein YflT n=1 Tax=Paenibacillus methanolicus TaxID=582686 RepID=A0A5S5BPX7_9BACL|nr:YoaH family protein [Paenibacillus methanolicus]TYP68396.1 heat induced stress protein YflT [Paenibacillus methanolicus]
MAYKLGIFSTQQQAIEAIQALEAEGIASGAIRVIAKDHEHTNRIESETNVHADEVNDVTETRHQIADHDGAIGIVGLAAGSVGSGYGTGTPSAVGLAPYYGAAVFSGIGDGDSDMIESLRALGISGGDAETCRDAIAEGAIVVAAETGDAASGEGPDLTPVGAAEAAFRRAGARTIL